MFHKVRCVRQLFRMREVDKSCLYVPIFPHAVYTAQQNENLYLPPMAEKIHQNVSLGSGRNINLVLIIGEICRGAALSGSAFALLPTRLEGEQT